MNTLAELLWRPDLSAEDKNEIDETFQMWKDMTEAPEGFYPWSWVRNSNAVNKLTPEEKLTCIRLLPPEIANKLFPHV